MELLVHGNRLKRKRSEPVKEFDLEGVDDAGIIRIAQKHIAADQRLAEAKEVANQRPSVSLGAPSAAQGEDRPADQPGSGDLAASLSAQSSFDWDDGRCFGRVFS